MYDDFKFLNYWRTRRKLKKIREMISRLSADIKFKRIRIDSLNFTFDILEKRLNNLILNLPDLTILSITYNTFTNHIIFYVTVKNIGKETSIECNLRNTIDTFIEDITVPELEPEASIVLDFSFVFNPASGNQSYNMISEVDSQHIMDELNEDNNILHTSFIGKEQYVGTFIVVHCHNQEGKEINSITDMSSANMAKIYVDDVFVAYGARNSFEHFAPISVTAGFRTVRVDFNGYSSSQYIEIIDGHTYNLMFEFTRREWNFLSFLNSIGTINGSKSFSYTRPPTSSALVNITEIPLPETYLWDWINIYLTSIGMSISGTLNSSLSINSTNITTRTRLAGMVSDGDFYGVSKALLTPTPIHWDGQHSFYHTVVSEFIENPPNFTNWFYQRDASSNIGGKCKLEFGAGNFIENKSTYDLDILNSGIVDVNIYLDDEQYYVMLKAPGITEIMKDGNGIFTIDNAYITSVPYDLDGNAV